VPKSVFSGVFFEEGASPDIDQHLGIVGKKVVERVKGIEPSYAAWECDNEQATPTASFQIKKLPPRIQPHFRKKHFPVQPYCGYFGSGSRGCQFP